MNHMKFVNWVTIWVVHLIYRYGPKPAGLTTVSEQTVGSAVLQIKLTQSRKENPQKPTQLTSRSHPRHLVGKRTAQKTPS